MLELVTSLVKLSRFREALDALRDCDPAPALLALAGECEQSLGRTDVALLRFGEALELDPQCVPGRLQRGTLFLTEGRLNEAAADFEAALKRAPHDSRIHYQLSQTYTRLGRRDEAALHLRLMQENQVVEVEFADLNRLAARNADDAELRFRIGSLALRLDKPELARMWFRSVLALDSNHAQARAALAAAEEPTVGQ